jgi:hypothetical protein
MRVEDAAAILGSRKSFAAKYILTRALIELVKATPRDALGEEMGMTLEQNAFNTYRAEKLEESAQSGQRRAVSQLQVELLGQLSTTRCANGMFPADLIDSLRLATDSPES